MNSQQSKIALITGGSRGLGRNMALHLARQGTGVILTYRSNRAEAEAVVAEIVGAGGRAASLQLDTGIVAGFDDFVARLRATCPNIGAADSSIFSSTTQASACTRRSRKRPKRNSTS